MAAKAAGNGRANFLSRWVGLGIEFFGEVKAEMVKVAWPTRDETVASTWVILAAVAVVAVWIFIADTTSSQTMAFLIRAFN
jgi:preprotein translocase subunit SecE